MIISAALFSLTFVTVTQCSQLKTYKCDRIKEAFTDSSSNVQLIIENCDFESCAHVQALRKWKDSLNVNCVLRLSRPEVKLLKNLSSVKRKKRVASMQALFKKRMERDLESVQVPGRTSKKVLRELREKEIEVELLPCASDESESEESYDSTNFVGKRMEAELVQEDEFDDYEMLADDEFEYELVSSEEK